MFRVTADDFGYCAQRNKGIKELIEVGLVNSISVIVNGACVEYMQSGKQQQQQQQQQQTNNPLHVGLHLNLTEGRPVSPTNNVRSLIGEDLMFLGKFGFRNNLRNSLIKESEMAVEFEAQVEKFLTIFGHIPDHVDGHQHIHVVPGVVDMCARVVTKYGIKITRIPRELEISACDWIEAPRLKFYEEVCSDALSAVQCFHSVGVSFAPYFIGLSTMSSDMSVERFRRALDTVLRDINNSNNNINNHGVNEGPGLVEIMVHPGYASVGEGGGCGGGPDQFSRSQDREYEMGVLKSNGFVETIESFEKTVMEK